jgi:HSP20 family protein
MQRVDISKELLAQIDFANTVNGGMTAFNITGGKDEYGYQMNISAPSIDKEKINIEIAEQRFMVYYMIDVLEGEGQMPYFLANVPLLPDVDTKQISARFEEGKVHIRAPFNELGSGERMGIPLE